MIGLNYLDVRVPRLVLQRQSEHQGEGDVSHDINTPTVHFGFPFATDRIKKISAM